MSLENWRQVYSEGSIKALLTSLVNYCMCVLLFFIITQHIASICELLWWNHNIFPSIQMLAALIDQLCQCLEAFFYHLKPRFFFRLASQSYFHFPICTRSRVKGHSFSVLTFFGREGKKNTVILIIKIIIDDVSVENDLLAETTSLMK